MLGLGVRVMVRDWVRVLITEPGNKSREGRWTEHNFLSLNLPFKYY